MSIARNGKSTDQWQDARANSPAQMDNPVAAAAQQVFRTSPYLPIRDLTCNYHEGALIIRGRVPTFYLKQIAQTIAQKVAGVEVILNRVEVVDLSVWQPPPASVWSQSNRRGRRN